MTDQTIRSRFPASEIVRMLRLAVPVVFAELGWMGMGTVDTIMIGPLGPAAIGATGIGASVYYVFGIFGIGLLLGLDTLVSQSHGAGDKADTHHSLAQGIYGAILIGLPITLFCWFMTPAFYWLGINPAVAALAGPFVKTLGIGTVPLLLYSAFRRYLQATGHVGAVMFALVSANLVNWFFNWLLIFGHWGTPKLGVVGSGLSTCLARMYMTLSLLFFVWWHERHSDKAIVDILLRRPDPQRLFRLFGLGLPAAMQILMEVGAFSTASVLAGRLSASALAAHQIALNCASLTFMVPLGISSAAAVAVGQSVGAGKLDVAKRSGYIALGMGCTFMCCSALAFLFMPLRILGVYTRDAGVLTTGVTLLAAAAVFQLFDGIQTVTTGVLRGAGDTRTPFIVNFFGYWLFGLPIGYWLCFTRGAGVQGLWWGLTLALILIALCLLNAWRRHWLRA